MILIRAVLLQLTCTLLSVPMAEAVERVNLQSAGKFVVLTKSGVTNTGPTNIFGDMGVSPIAATAFTGFALRQDPSTTFSTSTLVTGNLYAADYMVPTPSMLTVAVLDMQAAYTDAATRLNPDTSNLEGGLVDGYILKPGVHKWDMGLSFGNTLTFDGPADAVWILQVAGVFALGKGARMILTGGAKAENIFIAVAGGATFYPSSHAEGIFLSASTVIFQKGSSLNGAAFAQKAVTIIDATIVKEAVKGQRLEAMTYKEPVAPVDLGRACFAVLTKTGVTNTGPSMVNGDMGISPIAATAFTGFGLVPHIDLTTTHSNSIYSTGDLYAADYGVPTPAMLTGAVLDMQAAYVDAHNRPGYISQNLQGGLIDGYTLEQGIYRWNSGIVVSESLTFYGPPDAIWILQISGVMAINSGARIILAGGAKAENIFWAVSGGATLGTTSHTEGIILSMTTVVMQTGSTLNGAALAQTATTLDTATINRKSYCSGERPEPTEEPTASPTLAHSLAPTTASPTLAHSSAPSTASPSKAATASPTDAIIAATASPTDAIIAATASPTEALIEEAIVEATNPPIETPVATCPNDVVLVKLDGVTSYPVVSASGKADIPVVEIIEQDTTTVTVSLSQLWSTSEKISSAGAVDAIYYEYKEDMWTNKCHEATNVKDREVFDTITIQCYLMSPYAHLQICVADSASHGILSTTGEDDATIPKCCHSEQSLLPNTPTVCYSLEIRCDNTCDDVEKSRMLRGNN